MTTPPNQSFLVQNGEYVNYSHKYKLQLAHTCIINTVRHDIRLVRTLKTFIVELEPYDRNQMI